MNELTTIDKPTKLEPVHKEPEAGLITFIGLMARGASPSYAYRQAFPIKVKSLNYETVRRYAYDLCNNSSIYTEVATRKERLANMTRLAEDHIEDVLVSGKHNKPTNDVAMFMYEQANGKATQKTEVIGKHVLVTYDLSGGQAGAVPQEILDQLAD